MKWTWTKECENAFAGSQSELTAGEVLVSYVEKRKLILGGMSYGVGAVISHEIDDGEERPLHSHPEHSREGKRTIFKLRRKPWKSYSEYGSFTSTCMDALAIFVQITSL